MKNYLDRVGLQSLIGKIKTKFKEYLPLSGGKMTGPIDMGNHTVSNLTDPSEDADAATKAYVDTHSAAAPKLDHKVTISTSGRLIGSATTDFSSDVDIELKPKGTAVYYAAVDLTKGPYWKKVLTVTVDSITNSGTVATRLVYSQGNPQHTQDMFGELRIAITGNPSGTPTGHVILTGSIDKRNENHICLCIRHDNDKDEIYGELYTDPYKTWDVKNFWLPELSNEAKPDGRLKSIVFEPYIGSSVAGVKAELPTNVDSQNFVEFFFGPADSLSNPISISLTGDVTGSVSFDGSKDVSISSTRRSCIVGRNNGETTNPWYKVASMTGLTITSISTLVLSINDSFSSNKPYGILYITVRIGEGAKVDTRNTRISWVVNTGLDPSKFVLLAKPETSTVTYELWHCCDQPYNLTTFTVISETNNSKMSNNLWQLKGNVSAGSQASLPDGYTQFPSTIVNLQNPSEVPMYTNSAWDTNLYLRIGSFHIDHGARQIMILGLYDFMNGIRCLGLAYIVISGWSASENQAQANIYIERIVGNTEPPALYAKITGDSANGTVEIWRKKEATQSSNVTISVLMDNHHYPFTFDMVTAQETEPEHGDGVNWKQAVYKAPELDNTLDTETSVGQTQTETSLQIPKLTIGLDGRVTAAENSTVDLPGPYFEFYQVNIIQNQSWQKHKEALDGFTSSNLWEVVDDAEPFYFKGPDVPSWTEEDTVIFQPIEGDSPTVIWSTYTHLSVSLPISFDGTRMTVDNNTGLYQAPNTCSIHVSTSSMPTGNPTLCFKLIVMRKYPMVG